MCKPKYSPLGSTTIGFTNVKALSEFFLRIDIKEKVKKNISHALGFHNYFQCISYFFFRRNCQIAMLFRFTQQSFVKEIRKKWNERSSVLNCTKRNAFLCLPNENLAQLLAFCYSVSKIRIQEVMNNFRDRSIFQTVYFKCYN